MTLEELERHIKQTELDIKKAELKSKLEEQAKTSRFSITTSIPLLIAIVGLAASGVTALIQRDTSIRLEKEKFRSSLLLKALEADGTENISKTLLFMVETNILSDEDSSIRKAANNPSDLPTTLYNDTTTRLKYGTPLAARSINAIVVSDTNVNSSYDSLLTYLKQPQSIGSYHYVIDRDGQAIPMVEESLIAYHTAGFNNNSIGIAVMHIANSSRYSTKQVASLKTLITKLSKKYNIRPANINSKKHYIPHRTGDFELVKPEIIASLTTKK